jgi:hypothetical protein
MPIIQSVAMRVVIWRESEIGRKRKNFEFEKKTDFVKKKCAEEGG